MLIGADVCCRHDWLVPRWPLLLCYTPLKARSDAEVRSLALMLNRGVLAVMLRRGV